MMMIWKRQAENNAANPQFNKQFSIWWANYSLKANLIPINLLFSAQI